MNKKGSVRIAITGAHGMLGNTLCREYNDIYEVHAFHRDNKCLVPCYKDYSLQLENEEELFKVLESISPKYLIHCAGLIDLEQCEKDPEHAYKQNVDITRIIAKACRGKTKLFYISTDQVYGKGKNHTENTRILKPLNVYGKTKLAGEQVVKEIASDYLIIRTNIFGWNIKLDSVSSAEWIYQNLKEKKEITLFTDYFFTPIFAGRLARIILELLKSDKKNVLNIGSKTKCSKYEFGIEMSKLMNCETSFIHKGSIDSFDFKAPRAKNLSLNIKKASDFGICLPGFEESIQTFLKVTR